MTLVTVSPYVCIPPLVPQSTGGHLANQLTIDAPDEAMAMIFQVPKTGTCIGADFRTGTVVTGATVTVSLQTVDAITGVPTGTLYHANATVTQVIGDADDATWFTVTWTGFTVTQGDVVAIVITAPASGTFDIDIIRGRDIIEVLYFPYSALFTTSWARSSSEGLIGALRYTGNVYHQIPGLVPYDSSPTLVFNNTDSPNEIGNRFKLPPITIVGIWARIRDDNTTDYDLVLYDDADVAQRTHNHKSGYRGSVSGHGTSFYFFDSEYNLPNDTVHHIILKPISATDIKIRSILVSTVELMGGMPGGPIFHRSHRTDEGAWTDVDTEVIAMGLIVKAFQDGIGGGAASILGGGSLHGDFG